MSIERQSGALQIDGVSCVELAEQFGTPLYAYSRSLIEQAWQRVDRSLASRPHLICYAVKANSSLAVLDTLARLGSGFDIVSGGELKRVLAAGGQPDRIVFSGVGKTLREMEQALEAGIRCFNVESASELERLAQVAAAHGVAAPVSFRINPDVDAGTHPYISTGLRENKFGIPMEDAPGVYHRAMDLSGIDVQGIDCHIGSQLMEITPYREAIGHLVDLVDQLAAEGIQLTHIDVGGGQGIAYESAQTPLDIEEWAGVVLDVIGDRRLEIMAEPGRFIVGNAGVLLTRVEYLKNNGSRHFAIVDAAMNDLIRPALYSAWQAIEPVQMNAGEATLYDIVGPVCESADFLGKQRALAVDEGDYLAVLGAGAYAAVMSSNYNTRPRAAEVMVAEGEAHLVRAREETEALFAREYLLP